MRTYVSAPSAAIVTAMVLVACAPGVGGPPAPIDAMGTDVTETRGRVTSACFTYEIPPFSGLELDTSSGDCATAVNIPRGDNLTAFTVRLQTGAFSEDIARESYVTSSTFTDAEVWTETINGNSVVRSQAEDLWGLTNLFAVVDVPDGTLVHGGEPITGIYLHSYGSPDLSRLFDQILESLTLVEPE